jgi:hypothetical protein
MAFAADSWASPSRWVRVYGSWLLLQIHGHRRAEGLGFRVYCSWLLLQIHGHRRTDGLGFMAHGFCCRFMGIAEQMGKVLQRTSISVNIKERLDFSCAMFGPDGALVNPKP